MSSTHPSHDRDVLEALADRIAAAADELHDDALGDWLRGLADKVDREVSWVESDMRLNDALERLRTASARSDLLALAVIPVASDDTIAALRRRHRKGGEV